MSEKQKGCTMNFYNVVESRLSIRKYRSTPVEQEKLDRIFQAVRIAPSACNFQPWRFLIVKSKDMRSRVERALQLGRDGTVNTKKAWVMDAPLILIGLGNRKTAWKRYDGTSSHVIDVTIATEHLVLAAANEGLGTCWVCAFDQEAMHTALELDPDWEVVVVSPLGYPEESPEAHGRKAVSEIVEVI